MRKALLLTQDEVFKKKMPIVPSGAVYVLIRPMGLSCQAQDGETLVTER